MLHDRYRPKTWADFQGNADVVQRVRALVERSGYSGGALWVCGPSGCGKTTLAHLVAASVGASEFGIHEMRGSKCGVDAVHKLEEEIGKSVLFNPSGWRVWIVNEAHAMTGHAVQAWLTLLGDPPLPPKRLVVFTTTETAEEDLFGNFTGPLLSRCNVFKLRTVGELDAAMWLRSVAQAEGLDGQPIDAYVALYRAKKSNLRSAISAIEAGEMLQ